MLMAASLSASDKRFSTKQFLAWPERSSYRKFYAHWIEIRAPPIFLELCGPGHQMGM